MSRFPSAIQFIQSQERVSAAVTNRPLDQLAARTEDLRRKLASLDAGEAVMWRDVPVTEASVPGSPVYWDVATGRCELAYASAVQSCGDFVAAPQADCLGLVYQKHTATSADVALFGVVNLPAINELLPPGTGRIFLGAEPGTLTFQGPSVEIPVGFRLGARDACDDCSSVFVNPEFSGVVFPHSHHSVTLDPAHWETLTADDTAAPPGAVMVYRVAQDDALRPVFPPVPLESVACTIDWDGQTDGDRLTETLGAREIAVNTPGAVLRVTTAGIWWCSEDLLPNLPLTDDTYANFRITLHFSRVRHDLKDSFVTSLQPDAGHPFQFVNCRGEEADRGDLFARFTLADTQVDSTDYSGKAVRQLTSSWKQEIVPAIHGIASAHPALQVSSNAEPFAYRDATYHRGLVRLGLSLGARDVEIQPLIVKLDSALESEYQNITHLAFPYNCPSALKLKLEIPAVIGGSGPLKMAMRLTCLALAAGNFPPLTLQYVRVPRMTGSLTPHLAPVSVALNTSRSVQLADIFEAESAPFAVERGDTLIVIISRDIPGGYMAQAGLIRVNGILNEEA